MEENNSSSKELPKYDKKDFEQCISKFQNYILNNINDIQKIKNTLLTLSKERKTESELMSSFSLKIYLNTLSTSKDTSLKTWLEETLSQRNSYKEKLKNLLQINQFKGDPLGGGDNGEGGGWNNFFDKSEIKKLINLDVERTFQERDLFCEASIKEIEYNVLFLFAENNQPINYKQGMSDILAMLIFILYPYYIKSENKEYNNEIFEKWVNEPSNYIKDIYYFFHDEDEFQSDLYYLMNNLMKLGINKFYEENKDKEEKKENYLIQRCDNIFEKLKNHNYQLYYHFINNKLDIGIILQRWIKCLFTREFHPKDIILILDAILSNEISNPSGELIYIDYFCIAMIDFISDELLKKDQNECFKRLFTYPPLESIDTLINLADNNKLNKKDNKINNINEHNFESKSVKKKAGSMADFLFSSNKTNSTNNTTKINNTNNKSTSITNLLNNNTNNNKKAKAPNLMFGGNYSNTKKNEPTNSINVNSQKSSQQTIPKKIPLFGNINNNSQDNKNKSQPKTFTPTFGNTRAYTVSNEENVKMLNELKGLVDYYIKEFSYEDKMKIGFLIEKLGKEL